MLKLGILLLTATLVTGFSANRKSNTQSDHDYAKLLQRLESDEKQTQILVQNVDSLMRDNAELKQENQEIRETLENVQSKQANGDIIFYTHLATAGDYSVPEGAIIQFDVVVANLGNGYNPASGTFTALQNGYYMFTLFFQTQGGNDSDLAILVNDAVVCRGDGVTEWDQGTCTAVVELSVGDVVNVKAVDGGVVLNADGIGHINGFTGFLYYAL